MTQSVPARTPLLWDIVIYQGNMQSVNTQYLLQIMKCITPSTENHVHDTNSQYWWCLYAKACAGQCMSPAHCHDTHTSKNVSHSTNSHSIITHQHPHHPSAPHHPTGAVALRDVSALAGEMHVATSACALKCMTAVLAFKVFLPVSMCGYHFTVVSCLVTDCFDNFDLRRTHGAVNYV